MLVLDFGGLCLAGTTGPLENECMQFHCDLRV
jgi:hypothetical protein